MVKKNFQSRSVSIAVSTALLLFVNTCILAQEESTAIPSNVEQYRSETLMMNDGTFADRVLINGPPTPPPGYERPVVYLPPHNTRGSVLLTVPAFSWCFGCSATSAAMMAGYYDRNNYDNMYRGPTNGGVMILHNDPTKPPYPNWFLLKQARRGREAADSKKLSII